MSCPSNRRMSPPRSRARSPRFALPLSGRALFSGLEAASSQDKEAISDFDPRAVPLTPADCLAPLPHTKSRRFFFPRKKERHSAVSGAGSLSIYRCREISSLSFDILRPVSREALSIYAPFFGIWCKRPPLLPARLPLLPRVMQSSCRARNRSSFPPDRIRPICHSVQRWFFLFFGVGPRPLLAHN